MFTSGIFVHFGFNIQSAFDIMQLIIESASAALRCGPFNLKFSALYLSQQKLNTAIPSLFIISYIICETDVLTFP